MLARGLHVSCPGPPLASRQNLPITTTHLSRAPFERMRGSPLTPIIPAHLPRAPFAKCMSHIVSSTIPADTQYRGVGDIPVFLSDQFDLFLSLLFPLLTQKQGVHPLSTMSACPECSRGARRHWLFLFPPICNFHFLSSGSSVQNRPASDPSATLRTSDGRYTATAPPVTCYGSLPLPHLLPVPPLPLAPRVPTPPRRASTTTSIMSHTPTEVTPK